MCAYVSVSVCMVKSDQPGPEETSLRWFLSGYWSPEHHREIREPVCEVRVAPTHRCLPQGSVPGKCLTVDCRATEHTIRALGLPFSHSPISDNVSMSGV